METGLTGKNKITGEQIKKVHTLTAALKLEDKEYRKILLNSFNVTSSKELDTDQAQVLIKALEAEAIREGVWKKLGVKSSSTGHRQEKRSMKKHSDLEHRRGPMATPAQLRKIEAQWADVTRAETQEGRKKALRAFLERVAKVSDVRFLTAEGSTKVINALISMQKEQEGRVVRREASK